MFVKFGYSYTFSVVIGRSGPLIPLQPEPRQQTGQLQPAGRRKMLDEDVHATLDDLAKAKGIGNTCVNLVERLTLLEPEFFEAILDARPPDGEEWAQRPRVDNARVKALARAFPYDYSIVRLIGAARFEQNDEWQSQHRHMQFEVFAQIDAAESDLLLSIKKQAARQMRRGGHTGISTTLTDVTRSHGAS